MEWTLIQKLNVPRSHDFYNDDIMMSANKRYTHAWEQKIPWKRMCCMSLNFLCSCFYILTFMFKLLWAWRNGELMRFVGSVINMCNMIQTKWQALPKRMVFCYYVHWFSCWYPRSSTEHCHPLREKQTNKFCAASKIKTRSEGPVLLRGPERSEIFDFARQRSEK